MAFDRKRTLDVAIPAMEAVLPIAAAGIGVWFFSRTADQGTEPHRQAVTWGVTAVFAVLFWAAGVFLRRTDDGMRVLLALAAGTALAGGILLWRADGEAFPGNAGKPETSAGMLAAQVLIVGAAGLAAAFGIDYRRSDPWYVVGFLAGLAPLVITGAVWLLSLREATWL